MNDRRHRAVGSDDGQSALLLVVVVSVLMVVMVLAVAAMGRTAIDRTQAQTAADAAALASLGGGRSAAVSFATRHGATVTDWSTIVAANGRTVTVRVVVGASWATARATDSIDD